MAGVDIAASTADAGAARLTRQGSSTAAAHEDELRRLELVAQDFAAAAGMKPAAFLRLLPELPADLLTADNAIQRSHDALRATFLRTMAEQASGEWLTPVTGAPVHVPGDGDAYRYAYDRQHRPGPLEARLVAGAPPAGCTVGAMLCSSGMAAINVVASALAHMLRARAGARLAMLGGYFETFTLLRLSSFARRWARVQSTAELADGIRAGAHAVVLVEPLQYDWSLGTVDWDELFAALAATDHPPVVVIDTTLSGSSRELDAAIERLQQSDAPLVVCVRSGLKLDQEGFELANVGVVQWSGREGEQLAAKFSRAAAACRIVTGAGLGRQATCALSPRFVFDRARLRVYSESVFATNRALHESVELRGALFERSVHPPAPSGSPFVLFALRAGEGDRGGYVRLALLLRREAARRGLDWRMSGSFGFRTDRYETILPAEQLRTGEQPEGVLKVACGSYEGARFRCIVELLGELASFDSLDEVERSWRKGTR